MPVNNEPYLMGSEIECLSAVPDDPTKLAMALGRFIEIASQLVPSVPAITGIFTPYGRLYIDCEHAELATAECDSPYMVCLLTEQLQTLAQRVVAKLAREGIRMVLANNNHSGLLQEGCAVWGDHENHLVETNPAEFGAEILPFLITRIYGGAGGVRYPDGAFLAGVRPTAMELPTGGDTTHGRAIHSTSREEHHVGRLRGMYRYHLILADGHRSAYNTSLMFGCTSLAIKAALWDRRLRSEARKLTRQFSADDMVATLKRFNVLALPGQPIAIDPMIIAVQRLYLEAARRYATAHPDRPEWVDRIIKDWSETLAAYERLDRPWLSARLDTFAKYEFYTATLQQSQRTWNDLSGNPSLFHELALLDQNYHEFANPRSVFSRLDRAGLLQHRVHEPLAPGDEPDPFIPQTATRARARALFIRDNKHRTDLTLDWTWAHDANDRVCQLLDPFAAQFSEWKACGESLSHARSPWMRSSHHILQTYDRGQYEAAFEEVVRFDFASRLRGQPVSSQVLRYRCWIQAHRGQPEALELLQQIHGTDPDTLQAVTDTVCVHRALNLIPNLETLESTIGRGMALVEMLPNIAFDSVAMHFVEHVACILAHNGRLEAAEQTLQQLMPHLSTMEVRLRARVLATMGEICRGLGDRQKALHLLQQAAEIQTSRGYFGYLSDYTYASLAKATTEQQRAVEWLNSAKEIQTSSGNRMGLSVTLLLKARIGRDEVDANDLYRQLRTHQSDIPALRQSAFLANILTRWNQWTNGEILNGNNDAFWGL